MVMTVYAFYHSTSNLKSLLFTRFCNLISDRIQNDRRMIIISLDHGSRIRFPPCFKITSIIIFIFSVVPGIKGFIHNIHSQFITRSQHCFTGRIMRASDGIKSGFFHDLHTSSLTFFPACRSQDPIVMMDTAASQKRRFSIYKKSLRTPGKLTDTKPLFCCIQYFFALFKYDLSKIKIRRFLIPEPCLWQLDLCYSSRFFIP